MNNVGGFLRHLKTGRKETFLAQQAENSKPFEEEPYHVVRVGVGCLCLDGSKVLLGLRHGSHAAGEWAFPGGKIDLGESPVETAVREFREETGAEFKEAQLLSSITDDRFLEQGKLDRHFITLYVAGSSEGDVSIMEPTKCLEWRWVEWEDLVNGKLPLMQGVSKLVQQIEF